MTVPSRGDNPRPSLIGWGAGGHSAHLVAFHLPVGKAIPACSHKQRLPYRQPPAGAPLCWYCAHKAQEYTDALATAS
jgi:hypothetical protein